MAVYPMIAKINHSCAPNAELVHGSGVDPSKANAQVSIRRSIRPGEQVYISYLQEEAVGAVRSLEGVEFAIVEGEWHEESVERRETLKQRYLFDCACPKCSIERELIAGS